MPRLFEIKLGFAKDTRLELEHSQSGDVAEYKLRKLSAGSVLKEYHRRALDHLLVADREPARAIEVPSYETLAIFVELLAHNNLDASPVVERVKCSTLFVAEGLRVELRPMRSTLLDNAEIYLFDDLIGGSWIWKDSIREYKEIK